MGVIEWFLDPANWTGENGIPVRTWQQIEISLAASLASAALSV